MKKTLEHPTAQLAAGIVFVALGVIFLIFAPLFALWSWNQLFGDIKTLEYTFWNWAAVFGISSVFKNFVSRNK